MKELVQEWLDVFTFQYVSINTEQEDTCKDFITNLHSNMFLLILCNITRPVILVDNLHSNMFLLILIVCKKQRK